MRRGRSGRHPVRSPELPCPRGQIRLTGAGSPSLDDGVAGVCGDRGPQGLMSSGRRPVPARKPADVTPRHQQKKNATRHHGSAPQSGAPMPFCPMQFCMTAFFARTPNLSVAQAHNTQTLRNNTYRNRGHHLDRASCPLLNNKKVSPQLPFILCCFGAALPHVNAREAYG